MIKLERTKVYRAGVTANILYLERGAPRCRFEVNPKTTTLDIRLELRSKGGGKTNILVQIEEQDALLILQGVVELLKARRPQT